MESFGSRSEGSGSGERPRSSCRGRVFASAATVVWPIQPVSIPRRRSRFAACLSADAADSGAEADLCSPLAGGAHDVARARQQGEAHYVFPAYGGSCLKCRRQSHCVSRARNDVGKNSRLGSASCLAETLGMRPFVKKCVFLPTFFSFASSSLQ